MEYMIELVHPVRGKEVVEFKTYQRSGEWFATGRGYGCSKMYAVECEAIEALIQAECSTKVVWL